MHERTVRRRKPDKDRTLECERKMSISRTAPGFRRIIDKFQVIVSKDGGVVLRRQWHMKAARRHMKAQLPIIRLGPIKICDENDHVIETENG